MKYTAKIKSEQTIQVGDKKITIRPGKSEMSDEEASLVANSPWGKRLVETEFLVFDEKIEVKEEPQLGLTLKPGTPEWEAAVKKRKAAQQENTGGAGEEPDEGDGSGDQDSGGDGSGDENEIPDFNKNSESGEGDNGGT